MGMYDMYDMCSYTCHRRKN